MAYIVVSVNMTPTAARLSLLGRERTPSFLYHNQHQIKMARACVDGKGAHRRAQTAINAAEARKPVG